MNMMTDDEKEVLRLSTLLWERWSKLDAKHPNDNPNMVRALHDVQALIALRVARRADPTVWWQASTEDDPAGPPSAGPVIDPPFTPQELAKVADPEGRAGWSYSPYRATLQLHGSFFALVTPNGKDALSPEDTTKLLRALNGSA